MESCNKVALLYYIRKQPPNSDLYDLYIDVASQLLSDKGLMNWLNQKIEVDPKTREQLDALVNPPQKHPATTTINVSSEEPPITDSNRPRNRAQFHLGPQPELPKDPQGAPTQLSSPTFDGR